jgi:ABC-type uncharacterized transport system substrate-binding protein
MKLAILLGAAILAAPMTTHAQPAKEGRMWRIGWLSQAPSSTGSVELRALREGLRELNYVEGRNLKVEARWADGDLTKLPGLVRALVAVKVDLICSAGTPASLAAKQATATIPIVFSRVAFPERTGLVASLARPGGNLTGVAYIGPEYGKRLELLREVSPKISRVALIYNDQNTASVEAKDETQKWAQMLRVAVEPVGVHDHPSLEAAFATIRRGKSDALMTTADALLASYRSVIVEFANRHHLIAMYGDKVYVEAGGLMFYGTSLTAMWHHAAIYVDRIFKGAKAGDLPVEQPTKFELIINAKMAKSLGVTIPAAVLMRADQVIE